jgi:hypothetical protein
MIKIDPVARKIPHQGKESENTNLARKSMEKNKPISNHSLKRDMQDYSDDEEPEYYRQPVMTKNLTANYLPPKLPERPSRLIAQSPTSVSAFQLPQKQATKISEKAR